MNINLNQHAHFKPWEDPDTGIRHYQLCDVPGEMQKVFYFASPGWVKGSDWLWFHAVNLPSCFWFPCAVNLNAAKAEVRAFPGLFNHSQYGEHPLVIEQGRAVLLPMEDCLYKVHVDQGIETVFQLPGNLKKGRHLFRLCTGVSESADKRYLVMDCNLGNRWLILLLDQCNGDLRILQDFPNKHHHCWFSPIDPELMLIAQGPGTDPITGTRNPMHIRMWLMDIHGKRYEPLISDLWFGHPYETCHEFWMTNGDVAWCDYDRGLFKTSLDKREEQLIWPRPLIHAHANESGTQFVGDYHPYKWSRDRGCSVWFYDSEQDHEICLRKEMAFPMAAEQQYRRLHVDPHPHFINEGKNILYTSSNGQHSEVSIVDCRDIVHSTYSNTA